MSEKNTTFGKFIFLYLTSIILVSIAVFKNFGTPPKMKARETVSSEAKMVVQQKLLFQIQRINAYFKEIESLEHQLAGTENDAQKIGKIATKIDKITFRIQAEVNKCQNMSNSELHTEIFKNYQHLLALRRTNDSLKKENLNAKEELSECKNYGAALTLK